MKKRLFQSVFLFILVFFDIFLIVFLYNRSRDLGLYHLVNDNLVSSLINTQNILLTICVLFVFYIGCRFFRITKLIKITVSVHKKCFDLVKMLRYFVVVLSFVLLIVDIAGFKRLIREYNIQQTIIKT